MVTEINGHCSINGCPRPGTHEERGESARWSFVIRYCAEHARQAEAGTPLGPVGIDPCRVSVEPLGASEPQTGGILPSVGPG